MIYVDLGFAVYLLIGAALGFVMDRREMKKDVPYGTMPSMLPLAAIRKVIFIFCIFLGVPALITGFIKALCLDISARWSEWTMKKSLRRLCKRVGMDSRETRRIEKAIVARIKEQASKEVAAEIEKERAQQ